MNRTTEAVVEMGEKKDGCLPLFEELLTRKALANQLNVSVRTVDSWTKRRLIPCLLIGRIKRYRLVDVLAALKRFERKAIGQ